MGGKFAGAAFTSANQMAALPDAFCSAASMHEKASDS
jgi:hypothetical protein